MLNFARFLTVFTGVALSLIAPLALAAPVTTTSLTGALHWRSVGPYTGGRVTTVAGVTGKPGLFYAAYAGAGVWETDNYGHTWSNITDKYLAPSTSGSVGAMAVAKSNPNIIYIGTGDSAPRNTVLPGHGMYKSTDAGKTWKYIGLGETHMINWILIDPQNPDVVYVAALGHLFGPNPQRGVFKTTDGGQTWKKILYVNDHTGAITMAMDPQNPNVVYAAMWQMWRRPWSFSSGGPSSGLYKSTDGGAHWTNISHNPGLPKGILGKIGVAVAPSDPKVVYALVQAKVKPGHPGGLYRSDNGGQSWALVNDSLNITQRFFYYGRVYVDPADANTIYLPNVGVYVSHDGGKTLTALHPPHGDNHAFWINPNNPKLLIEGNDGGASVTRDGGEIWSSEDNQPTGQFYHVDLDNQFPFHIYGAQQDRGSNDGPSAVPAGKIPAVWTNVTGGEMSWVVPTPGKPWITYGNGYYGRMNRENRHTGLTVNVSPWPAYKFGWAESAQRNRFGWWYLPVVFAPGNANELLLGGNKVLKSLDQGEHWTTISPDLTRNDKSKQGRPGGPISADVVGEESFDTLSAIAVSPLSDKVIWTGSDDGLVYVTTDSGEHWEEVRPPKMPKWCTVSSVEPSYTQLGTAYVTAGRYRWDDLRPYVYKTTDYGKHWVEITNGLPDDEYVDAIRQDPNDPSLLFVATSATVYFSLDDGDHWQPLKLNLPVVRVTDLEIQPAQHAVVISTYGRAFWVLDNLQYLEQVSSARVQGDASFLFKPQQTWLVSRREGGFFGGRGPGGENLPVGATVFFHLPDDYDGNAPVKLSFTDASGKLINSFTLPEQAKKSPRLGAKKPMTRELHPGMNRFQWNLRYPEAAEVQGIYHSGVAASEPIGPEVVPGTYYAVLTYAGTTEKQPFTVTLDPRLHTTQAQLQERFALLMRIHDAINRLDTTLNDAIDTRSDLEKALASKSVSAEHGNKALADLNRDIAALVDLRIQSQGGALVFQPELRAWLSGIYGQVAQALVAPTAAMVQVADKYVSEERNAVPHLQADVAAAKAVLRR